MRFTVVIYRVAFFNISRNRLPEQAPQKYSRYDLLASVERERRNLIYGFNTSSVVLACATYFRSLHLCLYTARVHYLFQFTILLVDLAGFEPASCLPFLQWDYNNSFIHIAALESTVALLFMAGPKKPVIL